MASLINFAATIQALQQFLKARLARRAIVWSKTAHVYPRIAPGVTVSFPNPPRLGEILIDLEFLSAGELEYACTGTAKAAIGEYLVQISKITIADLNQALKMQAGLSATAGDYLRSN
jgi:hypothetical protein